MPCSVEVSLFQYKVDSADLDSTPLLQDWLGDDQPKRFRREVHFPTGRFGEAIEQAHAVVFLASDESSFVNGTDFVVDGGMSRVCYFNLFALAQANFSRRMLPPRAQPLLPLRTWAVR